jgi:hypothetical protein
MALPTKKQLLLYQQKPTPKPMKKSILTRLGQASTWRGIIALATICGVAINPEMKDAIIQAGVSVIALILMFKKT